VSTTEKDKATQKAKLKAADCSLIRTETVSAGSQDGRSELASILGFIRPGDTLIMVKSHRGQVGPLRSPQQMARRRYICPACPRPAGACFRAVALEIKICGQHDHVANCHAGG
jgi:hypothetical protein